MTLHNDWGLTDHAEWQRRLIPDGSYMSAQMDVAEEIVRSAPERLRKYPPYHVAFGMISQFLEDDIIAFCEGQQAHERWARYEPIEARYGERMAWVASDSTLALLTGVPIDRTLPTTNKETTNDEC